jgi:hypothetical protein
MAKVVTTLADAKAQLDCARKAARDVDRLSGAFIDRIAADALMAAKGASPERAASEWPSPSKCSPSAAAGRRRSPACRTSAPVPRGGGRGGVWLIEANPVRQARTVTA